MSCFRCGRVVFFICSRSYHGIALAPQHAREKFHKKQLLRIFTSLRSSKCQRDIFNDFGRRYALGLRKKEDGDGERERRPSSSLLKLEEIQPGLVNLNTHKRYYTFFFPLYTSHSLKKEKGARRWSTKQTNCSELRRVKVKPRNNYILIALERL